MFQNTTHFVIGLLLAFHAFVGNVGENVSKCEIREYLRCFEVFLDTYRNANKTQSLQKIYCNSYEGLMQCVISNLGCSGGMIDGFRFIVLQHMTVDKKLRFCTYPDLSRFEQVFHDKAEYLTKIAGWKDLEADDFAPCAAKANRYCAIRLVKELMENKKAYCDVHHFMKCYRSLPCEDKIYKDFVEDMTRQNETFTNKYIQELPRSHAQC